MMKTLSNFVLEKNTEAFIDKLTALGGKPIYQMTPAEARATLEKIQSTSSVKQPSVDIEEKILPVGPQGKSSIRVIRPKNSNKKLPVTIYVHGAGWVMGSATTHDHLVRELAVGADTAVVFVNYPLSPEAKYPVAIEESYAVMKYVAEHGNDLNLDSSRLAVAGDSVGGNMAIALTFLAKERKGPKIACQLLLYPVTSSEMDTPSYERFAEGPWLTKPAMEWFWNAYELDTAKRREPLLSPLRATIDQLQGLPPALVITAENDVLRDEGEAYAHKLMQAGVHVTAMRMLGTIHDFLMLNALAATPAALEGMALANAHLRHTFQS